MLAALLGVLLSLAAFGADCGLEGQACCRTGPACQGELGCSGGQCRGIEDDSVAYANYCKRALGFTNPEAPLPYLSCTDSAQVGSSVRVATGRQAQIRLTREDRVHDLRDNGPDIQNGRDVWDLIEREGCDNPNYLHSACDDYYRLNVWNPDPGNSQIVAVMHCRSGTGVKPEPANAIMADKRLEAYLQAPRSTPVVERTRLFDQWNSSSEIVLILSNLENGKTCFFHAASPYYGSRVPAPDDERPLDVEKIWGELPVKPPYGKADRQEEWLRNGRNAWKQPNFMACTGCHDNGPFISNPFITSMDRDGVPYLPHDKRWRPYLPLGYQRRASAHNYFIKTAPVRKQGGGTEAQKCTSCHSLGNEMGTSSWLARAAGWQMPAVASAASRVKEHLKRYMPPMVESDARTFYEKSGAHIDAIKCCAENPNRKGCFKVSRASPLSAGIEGAGPESCTDSSCGGWGQPCCEGRACNHGALSCTPREGGTRVCRFLEELEF